MPSMPALRIAYELLFGTTYVIGSLWRAAVHSACGARLAPERRALTAHVDEALAGREPLRLRHPVGESRAQRLQRRADVAHHAKRDSMALCDLPRVVADLDHRKLGRDRGSRRVE